MRAALALATALQVQAVQVQATVEAPTMPPGTPLRGIDGTTPPKLSPFTWRENMPTSPLILNKQTGLVFRWKRDDTMKSGRGVVQFFSKEAFDDCYLPHAYQMTEYLEYRVDVLANEKTLALTYPRVPWVYGQGEIPIGYFASSGVDQNGTTDCAKGVKRIVVWKTTTESPTVFHVKTTSPTPFVMPRKGADGSWNPINANTWTAPMPKAPLVLYGTQTTVVFAWINGVVHNVYRFLDRASFQKCDFSKAYQMFPDRAGEPGRSYGITFKEFQGSLFYGSKVGTDCREGLKVEVLWWPRCSTLRTARACAKAKEVCMWKRAKCRTRMG